MDFKQQHIRNFLRIISGLILLAYLYNIAEQKIKNATVNLNINDGYIILGCVTILIAIEAVRLYVKRKARKL